MGNKGALIKLKGKTLKPNFVKFTAVVINILKKPHPAVPPMKYANPWMFF